MSGLLGLLDLGGGALLAQSAGVSAVGRNVANVNTPGYSRETVDLVAQVFGGVRAGNLNRAQDEILSARERIADGAQGYASDLSAHLTGLEDAMNGAGKTMVDAIAQLFGGITELAAAPNDGVLRSKVVELARAAAASFSGNAAAIAASRSDADQRIATDAEAATQAAAEIAKLNRVMNVDHDPTLSDQRDAAARKLSTLVGGAARIDTDGKMRFVLDNGAVLVDGERAAQLTATKDAGLSGYRRVEVVDGNHRIDVTASLTSGKIGAHLAFRDGTAARAAARVDQLAYDFATRMNAEHRNHAALDGTTGHDLFLEPVQVQGAAGNMAVSAEVAADPGMLSGGFLELAALESDTLAAGGARTFIDEAIDTYTTVGQDAKTAAADSEVAGSRVDLLANMRNSLSGVSIEEELNRLSALQHAHEASTRFISTVDSLMKNLIESV